MEAPSEGLEVLLPQPVAVACGRHGMIARAVTLDRQHKSPRADRVLGHEINPVARRAPLRYQRNALGGKRVIDVELEGVERHGAEPAVAKPDTATGRVFEI